MQKFDGSKNYLKVELFEPQIMLLTEKAFSAFENNRFEFMHGLVPAYKSFAS